MLGKVRQMIKKFIKTALQGLLVFFFYPFLCFLPSRLGYKIVRWLGNRNFRRMRPLREEMIRELRDCLPERTEEERREIVRRVFQMQATFMYDSYRLLRYRVETWRKRYIRLEGAEHLEASHSKGKGVILCSMHFNHYFIPFGFLRDRFPTVGYGVWPGDLRRIDVVTKLHHRFVIWLGLWRYGVHFLAAGHHPKGELERVLRDNQILCILYDIALPEMRDLRPVRFFGQEIMFPWGLILVKYLTHAAFHIGYMIRDPEEWEKQTVIITPELTFSGKLAADQQTVVSELEKVIRRYPEFWWGWGLFPGARPEAIREARKRGDYRTSILGKNRDGPRGAPRK